MELSTLSFLWGVGEKVFRVTEHHIIFSATGKHYFCNQAWTLYDNAVTISYPTVSILTCALLLRCLFSLDSMCASQSLVLLDKSFVILPFPMENSPRCFYFYLQLCQLPEGLPNIICKILLPMFRTPCPLFALLAFLNHFPAENNVLLKPTIYMISPIFKMS